MDFGGKTTIKGRYEKQIDEMNLAVHVIHVPEWKDSFIYLE